MKQISVKTKLTVPEGGELLHPPLSLFSILRRELIIIALSL